MTGGASVVLDGVVVHRGGRDVLTGLSATFGSSGVTAIIGPNGAGKSLTLRLIDGLLRPDAGKVLLPPVRRAFVFQAPALVRTSVAANVRLALTPLRLPRREEDGRVAAALARVGLDGRQRDAARKLSGGEQQRLALARAQVVEPGLLLLDEPTANLDPGAAEEVEALVAAMSAAGTKVILVSHNLGQVARLAHDVLVLSQGRAVEHGRTEQVLSEPRSAAARAYIRREVPWTFYAAAS